jgi:hypothetical protein
VTAVGICGLFSLVSASRGSGLTALALFCNEWPFCSAAAPATWLSGASGTVGVRTKSPRPRATDEMVHAAPKAKALRGYRVRVFE